MMTVPENDIKGFTLMEILVTVSIISLVLVSLFRMQSGNIGLAEASRFKSTAPMLAKKHLAEIEQSIEEEDSESGQFEPPFENFTWQYEITDADFSEIEALPENETGALKKIELEIKQAETGKVYHIKTFRFTSNEK